MNPSPTPTPTPTPDDSHYLHGSSPAEQDRLAKMNEMMNGLALKEMALRVGESVLDVGSGLGQLTRGMARQVGSGTKVVGIERSDDQLREARRFAAKAGETALVDFRQGDANALPLKPEEWGTFDVAHTRFVLEHVRDPLGVVNQMVQAVRPGGRIILEDDAHDIFRVWPVSPGFDRIWNNYIRTYDRVGNDPIVGHRLVSLLHQAGALPQRNTWLFFGACAGQPELFHTCVENIVGILLGVREPILKLGDFEEISFDRCIASFREWGQRPDAAMWYGISWVEGLRGSQ
ncbi:MAG: methyltransferase domain-containing protein [Gemmataceae bacterium]|nr:methyltransferase domain-containing protein [Gemmataceae bacterium]